MAKVLFERVNKAMAKLEEKKLIGSFNLATMSQSDVEIAGNFVTLISDELIDEESIPVIIGRFLAEMKKIAGSGAAATKPVTTQNSNESAGLPAVREIAGLPVSDLFAEEAGAGFEETDSDDYAVPILRILQSGSPECDKQDPKYIEGAEQGKILNIATQEIYESVDVTVCAYRKADVEWVPRSGEGSSSGGGYVGEHDVSFIWDPPLVKNDKNKWINERGNEIARTTYFYCILVREGEPFENVVIAMASTQLSLSKKWMTTMNKIMFQSASGPYRAPIYSHIWTLATKGESKGEHKWKGWTYVKKSIIEDTELVNEAKGFRSLVKSGIIKVDQDQAADDEPEKDF